MTTNKDTNLNRPIINLQLTPSQAYIVQEALDLYSRIGMCQFDNLRHIPKSGNGNPDYQNEEQAFNLLHNLYCPELPSNGYYGIFNSQTPEESKIAWDIQQVLRYTVSWHFHPEGGLTVNFDTPMQSSKTEDLCKCEVKE